MNRTMRFVLCLALIMLLAVPSIALAGNGNGGKTTPPGQARKSVDTVAEPVAPVDGEPEVVTTGKGAKANAKVKDRAAAKLKARTKTKTRSAEASGSVDTTPTPKLTGIENAMSRIQANIDRAEARVADGTRKQVPPGLLSVLAKFMSWLGLTPVDGPDDGTVPQEPTSTVEPTGTVEPTPEPTATVEPTGTVEPTDTVEPIVAP